MSVPDSPSDSDSLAHGAPEQNHTTAAVGQAAGVSSSGQPPIPDGASPAPGEAAPPEHHKKPWVWIAVAAFLAAGVVGLGLYALNLSSDLDDANAELTFQQQQIDQAEDAGSDVVASAKSAYDDLSAELGAAREEASQALEQSAEALDQAEQAAADAEGTADEVQKEADAAQAKADAAATCAQSFLSALGGVFSGPTLQEGVEATVKELQALQPQCASALDQG